MKAILKSVSGETKGEVKLPMQFDEPVRPDLIKRAVLAIQSHSRQPYGTDPEAGKKYSAKISRRRRDYKTAYGIGISRVPRKIMSHKGTRFNWVGAEAPNTVGGREAHPPKADRKWERKINKKERRKAIRSAIAASAVKQLVVKRGHVVNEYPLVIDDSVENLKKIKEVIDFLKKIGLEKELERSSRKTERAGKARLRGRRFKKRKGPLFVVSKPCSLMNAASNIPGVEVTEVKNLNAELLAPGTVFGRLTLYTESSVEMLDKLRLFTDESLSGKESKGKDLKSRAVKKTKKTAEKSE